ncbi:hypothetical protein BGX27_004417 [Mortierella sp. AM989]|nr:hypothetical protein BGX27_004417 [Mortierella sp. AM989]
MTKAASSSPISASTRSRKNPATTPRLRNSSATSPPLQANATLSQALPNEAIPSSSHGHLLLTVENMSQLHEQEQQEQHEQQEQQQERQQEQQQQRIPSTSSSCCEAVDDPAISTTFVENSLGFVLVENGSQEVRSLFGFAQVLSGATPESVEHLHKKKSPISSNHDSSDNHAPDHDNSERASKRPRHKVAIDIEAFNSARELVRETRLLTEARNEQIRLMVVSQMMYAQLDSSKPPSTGDVAPAATPVAGSSTSHLHKSSPGPLRRSTSPTTS